MKCKHWNIFLLSTLFISNVLWVYEYINHSFGSIVAQSRINVLLEQNYFLSKIINSELGKRDRKYIENIIKREFASYTVLRDKNTITVGCVKTEFNDNELFSRLLTLDSYCLDEYGK